MPRNRDFINSVKHPRFVEFTNSKFYAEDFRSNYYQFLTVYDTSGEILAEYAHIVEMNKKNNYNWIKRSGEVIRCGELIKDLSAFIFAFNDVFIDLYVEDIYKSSPSLRGKRVFMYRLTSSDATKKTWGGNTRESKIERLYNLECVDDISAFTKLGQVIKAI